MGSGFRTFQSGEVLTSSNVQNYLMDQAISVFAGTAARGSAIASPETGMVSYRTDGTADSKREGFEFYDGANWTRLIPVASNTLVRVSTTSAFSGATTVSVNDVFSSTYTNYLILLDNLAAASGAALTMRLRVSGADNTTTNYAWGGQPVNYSTSGTTGESSGGTGANTSWRLLGSIGSGNKKGSVTLWINNPQTATATTYQAIGNNDDAAFRVSGQFDQTTSFTGFSLICTANISGNVTVYGIEKGS